MMSHAKKSRARGLLWALLGVACAHPTDGEEASGPDRPEASDPVDAGGSADPGGGDPTERGPWWRDAVFYEIFVRSFADSDGDGVGDLRGLTERLDALNDGDASTTDDLGVTALWLMPIHPSPSYHGYDVVDYDAVNPDYGTMEDLQVFLDAAHERGLRVIIDFVLNHSSSRHPWFLNARTGPEASRRLWYTFRPEPDPAYRRPWDGSLDVWHPSRVGYYYGLFWSGMPDLALDHPPVERAMLASMKGWLARGLDGFRVDAVRYLIEDPRGQVADTPATHALSRRIRAELQADFPQSVLVAEAWTGSEDIAPYYGEGDEYHLAFDFPTAGAVMTAAKDGLRASLDQALAVREETYLDPGFAAPFLTNHDMRRAQRQLDEAGASRGARPAAATLFALPGPPFVYYGEEIGMRGGPSGADEDKRTPMRWTAEAPGYGFTTAARPWRFAEEPTGVDVATQRATEGSLWRLYRDLITLRTRHPSLTRGALERPTREGGGRGTTGFIRAAPDAEPVLFVVNFADEEEEVVRFRRPESRASVLLQEGLARPPEWTEDGWLEVGPLGPRGFAFVEL